MTTQTTALVEFLGCTQSCKEKCICWVSPIMIGDVLEKMVASTRDSNGMSATDMEDVMTNLIRIIGVWMPLGFTKSLQEIFAVEVEVGFPERDHSKHKCYKGCKGKCRIQLTKPAQDLQDFLFQVFNLKK